MEYLQSIEDRPSAELHKPSESHNAAELHKNAQRILVHREGKLLPMFGAIPTGSLSPSPSLLVERFDLDEIGWQTHWLNEQIVTLFLKPTTIHYTVERKGVSEIPIASGNVAFCMRQEWHSLIWQPSMSVLTIRIADAALSSAATDFIPNARLELLTSPLVNDTRLAYLLQSLETERARGYPAGRLFIDGLEVAIAALIVGSYNAHAPKFNLNQGGLPPRLLQRVVEFMRANIDRPVTLEDIACSIGLSASHFSRQFRLTTGTTPHRYMLRLRVDLCKQMLRSPKFSLLEVAISGGFQNQQHFATVFRQIVGTSPSAYRRQC